MIHTLWTEKHRPSKIADYVFSDSRQKMQIDKWVGEQDVPHVLFYGPPGTGKSSLAKVLVNELNIDPYDYMFINASRERNIDVMRDKINSFVSTMPFGRIRIVQLDECDGLTTGSQESLRGIMEQYAASSRFLLTCNYPNKILPAIHSRTQSIEISKLDINEFTARVAEILLVENVEFELKTLDDYVRGTWPDMRKCINNCQQNTIGGKLLSADSVVSATRDYKIDAVSLFKSGRFREARELIGKQIRAEELEQFFRFLYDNLDLWGDTPEKKDAAILIIRKGLVQIPLTADAEILVAAAITELLQIN